MENEKNSSIVWKVLKYWLPFAAITTLLSGLTYVAVQQNYRQNANDPQIQISEDVAYALSKGAKPEYIIQPGNTIEMSDSLSPFLIIYDAGGKAVAAQVTLDGKTPELPAGVIDYTKAHGQDRITWQPKPNLRFAAVITKNTGADGGYALAGRSLREVEVREKMLAIYTAAAWLAGLVVTLILALLFNRHPSENKPQPEETPKV